MKFNRRWLWLIIPLIIFSLVWINSSSVSTVLLAVKGIIIDGNLIKFSGTVGVAEDAGVAASNVTKNKFDATSAPTVNNDVDEGYTVGSKWCDVTADKSWVCLDNTDSAAIWMETTGDWTFTHLEDQLFFGEFARIEYVRYSNFEATSAPTVNDDTDLGYVVGSLWYDTAADKGYTCLDITDGAAVWIEITSLGTTTFLGLTDSPGSYSGEGGNYVKVNVGENALEFGAITGETNTASNIGSQVEIYKQKTGVDLEFRTLKANSSKITVDNSPTPDIDIGSPAIGRPSHLSVGYTQIDKNNPANLSGTVTEVKMWLVSSASNLEVATFYVVSGNNLSTRDTEYIGAVTSGSEQTFEVSLEVESGDYIGVYVGDGDMELGTSGGVGVWHITGDYVPCTNQEFNYDAGWIQSTYGTGISGYLDYIKFDIVETEMDVVNLLSTTTVAFNADADTVLYTVPEGKRCVLSYAVVVAADDAGGTTTVSIGANGTEIDFIPANTLSNLDAEYDSVILMPIPNTTPLKIKSYAAETVIDARVATQSGVAGNTIYLFGILY